MEHTEKNTRHAIDFVFVLALLCVLAVSSLAVAAAGASVYRRAAASLRQDLDAEMTLRYVTEKIRGASLSGGVSITEENGSSVLTLALENEEYVTRIYWYDGALCEMLCRSDAVLPPENGQRITEVQSFSAGYETDDLLALACTDVSGRTSRCFVSLHSGG